MGGYLAYMHLCTLHTFFTDNQHIFIWVHNAELARPPRRIMRFALDPSLTKIFQRKVAVHCQRVLLQLRSHLFEERLGQLCTYRPYCAP